MQLHKVKHSGGLLGRLLEVLLKAGSPLIKKVLKPLAKSTLIPLGLTAAVAATDAAIQKNISELGMITLIISNEEIGDIMKIIKYFEESGFLIIGVSKTIKNEAKEQKDGFFGMLLVMLGTFLFENLLKGKGTIRAGEGTIRAREDFYGAPSLN